MPNRNGTGPEGKGPRTGRGLGPCTSTSSTQVGDKMPRSRGRGLRPRLGFRRSVKNVKENESKDN